MPSIHDVLIPAVGDGLAGAMKVGRKDPVTALRSWIPATIGQVEDGLELCKLATKIREKDIPVLEESRDELRKLGRLPHWIEATLFAYSNEADALASRAAEENVRDDISELGEDLERLKNNSVQAVELATQADTTAPQAVADTKKEVAAARRNLARMLGIQVKSLLSEDADIDPSRKLEEATSQITAAQTALDRGGRAHV